MSQEPQASPELLSLRNQIDSLDRQLLELVNQRAHVAEQVGELKKKEGSAFFRPDRVAQVIEKIKSNNPGPLKGAHVAAIWREIMSACLALESPQRVAVLGPAGTFCEEAAIQYFGGAADLMYCNSFEEVFHATAAGSAQYGVVGVENSNEGVVTRSLDMFLHTPCHVVGEVSMLIRHNLMRTSNTLDGIEVVAAHPRLWPSARAGCPNICPMPNVAPWRAMPKARAWRPCIPTGPALPVSAPPSSSACTSSATRSRTMPTTARVLPSSACRTRWPRPRPAAATAPAWWSRCPTPQVPCMTCWCR